MPNTVYIKFDRNVAGYQPQDLCSLADAFGEPPFKEIAAQLGVQPLEEFWDLDLDAFDGYFDEPDELESFKQERGAGQVFQSDRGPGFREGNPRPT